MGHSPRTVESNLRRRQQQQWAELMTKAKLDSLTEAEVELSEYPLTKAPNHARSPPGSAAPGTR